MKSQTKLIAAGMLLAGAAVVAIAISHHQHSDDRAAAAGRQPSAAGTSADVSTPTTTAASRTDRKARSVHDAALVEKYGESRTNLSRHIAGNVADLLGGLLEVADGFKLSKLAKAGQPADTRAIVNWKTRGIADRLSLSEEQAAKAVGILEASENRQLASAKDLIDRMKQDPTPLMEILLAGDALKSGKIDAAEYDRLKTEATGKSDLVGEMLQGKLDGSGDPLKDETVRREFESILDSAQLTAFNEAAAEAAPEESAAVPPMGGPDLLQAMDLEEADRKVEAGRKLSTGLKSLLEGIGEMAGGEADAGPID